MDGVNSGGLDRVVVKLDPEFEPLIPKFLAHRRSEVEALGGHLANGDFESIRKVAHALKGVGASYGFDAITDIGAAMEASAKASDAAGVGARLDDLRSYLERVDVVY